MRRFAGIAIASNFALARRSLTGQYRSTPREHIYLRKHRFLALVAATAFAFGLAERAAAEVTVREIVPPVAFCEIRVLNEAGDVLLECPVQPFVYSVSNQTFTPVTPPPGSPAGWIVSAKAMNNAGVVAALTCTADDTGVHGCSVFTWSRTTGGVTIIPAPTDFFPTALNDLGEMVFNGGAYLRRADGTLLPITQPGDYFARDHQYHLNNLSQVVLSQQSGFLRGIGVWSPTMGFVELPPVPDLPPDPRGFVYAFALSINDAGVVAGHTNRQAFVYSPSSGYSLLSGGPTSVASHVNALGHASGFTRVLDGPLTATYWRSPTDAIALPTYQGWAFASNSSGLVIGRGSIDGKWLLWNLGSTPPTPQQQVAQISAALTSFASSSLIDPQDAKGLTSKLDAINVMLGNADKPAAKNVLKALGNQVDALEKSKRISATTAASLRDLVSAALATL